MIIITDSECEAVPGSGISERVIFPEQREALQIMYAAMLRLEEAEARNQEWEERYDNENPQGIIQAALSEAHHEEHHAQEEILKARIAELEAQLKGSGNG